MATKTAPKKSSAKPAPAKKTAAQKVPAKKGRVKSTLKIDDFVVLLGCDADDVDRMKLRKLLIDFRDELVKAKIVGFLRTPYP